MRGASAGRDGSTEEPANPRCRRVAGRAAVTQLAHHAYVCRRCAARSPCLQHAQSLPLCCDHFSPRLHVVETREAKSTQVKSTSSQVKIKSKSSQNQVKIKSSQNQVTCEPARRRTTGSRAWPNHSRLEASPATSRSHLNSGEIASPRVELMGHLPHSRHAPPDWPLYDHLTRPRAFHRTSCSHLTTRACTCPPHCPPPLAHAPPRR